MPSPFTLSMDIAPEASDTLKKNMAGIASILSPHTTSVSVPYMWQLGSYRVPVCSRSLAVTLQRQHVEMKRGVLSSEIFLSGLYIFILNQLDAKPKNMYQHEIICTASTA